MHSPSPADDVDPGAAERPLRRDPTRWDATRRIAGDLGSVTAEFAAVVPAIILLLALCLGAVQLGSLQVRVQDAAGVVARVVARGQAADAAGVGSRLVPGSSLSISATGVLVCATIAASPRSGPFQSIRMTASSCAPASTP